MIDKIYNNRDDISTFHFSEIGEKAVYVKEFPIGYKQEEALLQNKGN